MLNVKLVCVGKLTEKFYKQAQDEYAKRLSRFVKLNIIELPDYATNNIKGEIVLMKEAEKILGALGNEYVIAMDILGKSYDSIEWAKKLETDLAQGVSSICFIIGGSLGLHDSVLQRANERMSMSKFTFCHNLARIMLLEQLFRVNKILANESYHK